MTLKELWHIKLKTRVSYDGLEGTVINRQVDDECSGFIIARERKTGKIIEKDLKTGNKYLTVTVLFDNGTKRYFDTLPPFYRLDYLKVIGKTDFAPVIRR